MLNLLLENSGALQYDQKVKKITKDLEMINDKQDELDTLRKAVEEKLQYISSKIENFEENQSKSNLGEKLGLKDLKKKQKKLLEFESQRREISGELSGIIDVQREQKIKRDEFEKDIRESEATLRALKEKKLSLASYLNQGTGDSNLFGEEDDEIETRSIEELESELREVLLSKEKKEKDLIEVEKELEGVTQVT